VSDSIRSYILGQPDPLQPRDDQGRHTDWGFGEGWDDHGRRRELCRYCRGEHDFNDCENDGDPKPGLSLVGMAEKWMKHTEALAALRAAAKAELEAE
jgi:hypothetical protein